MKTMSFYKERLTVLLAKRKEISIPIAEGRYVVMDTELTGLDIKKDSIISIGAVKMEGDRIELGNTFYRLISPSEEMRHEGIVVHGITPSDIVEKPGIEKVLAEFLDFCGSAIIVGHFISLDMGFIDRDMRRVHGTAFPNLMPNLRIDTRRIYEWIKANNGTFSGHYTGKLENLDLFTLAREFGIPVSEGHNALSDAFITAQFFQRFLSSLPGLGVRTIKDLLRIGKA